MAPKKKKQPKSLALIGKTYHYSRMIRGRHHRFSLETSDLKIALAKRDEYEMVHIHRGAGAVATAVTFDQAWAFIEQTAKHKSKGAGMKRDGRIHWYRFAQYMESIGVYTLNDVTASDVLEWQHSLCQPYGKKQLVRKAVTVNDYVHRAAGATFNKIVKLKKLKENPFMDVDKLVEEEVAVKSLPWEHVLRLLDTAKAFGRDMHLTFILGALGGLRKGEIQRAQWEDAKWTENLLWVRGEKNKSSADDIPLHPDLRAALEPYCGKDGEYIVAPEAVEEKGVWGYRMNWDGRLKQIAAAAGVGHCSAHSLRHSVAQRLVNTGHSEQEVARFLRHANGSYATRAYFKTRLVPIIITGSL